MAKRNDGLLADEDGNDADLFDFLLNHSKVDGNLDAAYKKIVKSIHKSHVNKEKRQMRSKTSMESSYNDEDPSRESCTDSVFTTASPPTSSTNARRQLNTLHLHGSPSPERRSSIMPAPNMQPGGGVGRYARPVVKSVLSSRRGSDLRINREQNEQI